MTLSEIKNKLGLASTEENYVNKASLCRDLLEECIDYIYELSNIQINPRSSLMEKLDSITVGNFVKDRDVISSLHYVRILGMNAKHGRHIRKKEASLALDNISYLVELISDIESGTVSSYKKPPYMSEAVTRKMYVDQYLREAGWDIVDTNNVIMPGKASVEVEVNGMPNEKGVGYCDYVLNGSDGKPLAIVEVKKTSVDAAVGRHQADLYAECMKNKYGYKPVIYYTNGYTIKVIDGVYPDRDVMSFHTLKDLEWMIQQRDRGDISDFTINNNITDRPYQKMAITNICEWLNAKHRRGLLVMATGTGKTRVAASLVDVLARNKWIKNVLFLADRTSLVNQAKRSFDEFLDMSVCELSGSGEKDLNARLMFCTYQTMIHYIDDEEKKFSIGRFDLIIIDEAHRSIFNRYGSIFKYFDGMLIGLTATPKNEVDANTYEIFGCEAGMPNFDYSLEEAIKDKYLVGYHVINRSSKLMSEGIKYNDLSDAEKEQFEDYIEELEIPTPAFDVPNNEIFKYLFNKNTCYQVLEELMQWGLRVNGGETIGKTIIFAYNHEHAQMIVDCFRELYPNLPANTCQLVDYSVKYADDLVLKFGEDDEFRIAVSVDMLDTGIDVTSVLNLIFFKKVRSKIKFVQMIGRGTRLCPDIFGPDRNKSMFQIFDYCGNFEYFSIYTDGKEGKQVETLSQRLFNVRMDMLVELQRLEYQENAWLKVYYDNIKNEMLSKMTKLKSSSNRIQVRENMQYVDRYYDNKTWESLSHLDVHDAKKYITPLLESGINGEYLSVAFDIRMYKIELSILRVNSLNDAIDDVKTIRTIAKYLLEKKASVPQVLSKANELKELRGDLFWENPSLTELEQRREAVRDLMKFLEGRQRKKYKINIIDEFENPEFDPSDTVIDIRTYKEKVMDYLSENSESPVIKKIYNLEPINAQDLDELEKVLWEELGTKEEYEETTNIGNLAAFIRSLIGLSQEAVNKKFGEYLSGNILNSQQQEFVKTIINYVRENGDIEIDDMVNSEPFNGFDINEMFGAQLPAIINIVNQLHDSVLVA